MAGAFGPPPPGGDALQERLAAAVASATASGRPVVLVTSGGTKVPLEKNAVRFIDNFSTGTRGSRLVEELVNLGATVVMLHRSGSKRPFLVSADRALMHPEGRLEGTALRLEAAEARAIAARRDAVSEGRLVEVEFESLSEYMWGMRACCQALASAGPTATAVLAAAVSDFYVKEEDLPEHKIQSRDSDGLDLRLSGVPKMLGALKLPAERASAAAGIALDDAPWCPRALVVSFKLETDPELLIPKARKSVGNYAVDAVIANLLEERYDECFLVSSPDAAHAPERIHRGPDEVIERPMAKAILQLSAERG